MRVVTAIRKSRWVDPFGGNVVVKTGGSEGWHCWPSFGAVGR